MGVIFIAAVVKPKSKLKLCTVCQIHIKSTSKKRQTDNFYEKSSVVTQQCKNAPPTAALSLLLFSTSITVIKGHWNCAEISAAMQNMGMAGEQQPYALLEHDECQQHPAPACTEEHTGSQLSPGTCLPLPSCAGSLHD